ncbi:hypothetical protein HPP92_006110 [Vanilla planifolia]|uniref:DUF7755 domain-containing protein n=1 Tax=Vanilla planifolia TaxID=51239 RepID=A0A835VBK5_VANPL|nr:hypothetical protein HPP92_006110 [Vanilla planifolia]
MELNFVNKIFSSVRPNIPRTWKPLYICSQDFSGYTLFQKGAKKRIDCSHFICGSKRSAYQDFQGFAKPLRLLPANEVTTYPMYISEEIISSVELDQSTAFYVVELCTSKEFGSGLRDLNAGILLCLIDDNTDAILQRISSISLKQPRDGEDNTSSEYIHFQRGSIDTITFKGSVLANIAAVWLGLESGSWRLDGVDIKVFKAPTTSKSANGVEKDLFSCTLYKFEANNILLGDGGLPVAELRPVLVTQLPKGSFPALSSIDIHPLDDELSKEASMKEYADLKLSLLLYDFMLVVAGAAILTITCNGRVAFAYSTGGIFGFLYLLLLQRSVDGLAVPVLQNSRGPVLSIAFVIGTCVVVASKLWVGSPVMLVSAIDLFVGVAGFLTFKFAVLLAAFKPLQINAKENNLP